MSVNGGTEKAKYKLAFIHQDQPSVMVGNGLKQNNLNASFNFKPFKFLTMEYRTRLLHKEVDGSGTEGVSLLDALRQAPTEGLDEYMTLPERYLFRSRPIGRNRTFQSEGGIREEL